MQRWVTHTPFNIEGASYDEPWTEEQKERLRRSCLACQRPFPKKELTKKEAAAYLDALRIVGMDKVRQLKRKAS